MSQSDELSALLESLSEQATRLLGADTASIWLLQAHKLVLEGSSGYPKESVAGGNISYAVGEGLIGWVVGTEKPFRGSMETVSKTPRMEGQMG